MADSTGYVIPKYIQRRLDNVEADDVEEYVERANKKALNKYFWAVDDNPTDTQKVAFLSKYEYEVYDLAIAMYNSDARNGQTGHTELGITRQWSDGGTKDINAALDSIPSKVYAYMKA